MLPTRVPGNMAHLFQPLDLTVNGYFKQFVKRKFVEWYSNNVARALDDGQDLESIVIDFKLPIKPLHAKWVTEGYDYITSSIGTIIYLRGWKKSEYKETLENVLEDNLDTFKDIDPIETAKEVSNNLFVINIMYLSQQNLDDYVSKVIRIDINSLSLCLL